MLLLVSNIYTAKVVSILLLTLVINVGPCVLIGLFGGLLVYFVASVAVIAIGAKIVFVIIGLFLDFGCTLCKHAIITTRGLVSECIGILDFVCVSRFIVEVLIAEPVVIEAQPTIKRLLNNNIKHHHLLQNLFPNIFHDITYNISDNLLKELWTGLLLNLGL